MESRKRTSDRELQRLIDRLVDYGIRSGLIGEADRIYITNRYLELFLTDGYADGEYFPEENRPSEEMSENLPEILSGLLAVARERGLLQGGGSVSGDLFDTKIMGIMTPAPSEVQKKFWTLYQKNPETATDWFYRFCQDTNYIRRDRIKKDRRWKVKSVYGEMDITINLSKPEKDPEAIAAARYAGQSGWPKCQLCVENEGYAGRLDHPARQNLRIIPLELNGERWGFQYSPYVYYNEHCIVMNRRHVPMKIDRNTFARLFDFVTQFPHYFLGSNADLPIVGGSILSHDHFQGGQYVFAMEKARVESAFTVPGFEDVAAGILLWPLSVIRLRHEDVGRLAALADHILNRWRGYTDEAAFVFAKTGGEPHNTITPIARKRDGVYELDLTLRNNLTTKEYPLGVYHPHAEYHHIKKENIGLIEAMGLAVLPSRLKGEMELLGECLVSGRETGRYAELEKHRAWAEQISSKYKKITQENVADILREEIGQVFVRVLENAGVYKCDEAGRAAFFRFVDSL